MRKLIIAFLLLAISATPIFAGNFSLTRTQTIYSVLDWTGKSIEVSAVNWIRIAGNGKYSVVDQPELTEITSLDPELKPIKRNAKNVWDIKVVGTKDIFYIGKTTKPLPVDVDVELKLDKKTAKPEEIVGKSGEVSIDFTFTNNSSKKELLTWSFGGNKKRELRTIYQPMTVMVQIDMNVESFNSVTAPDAFSMVIGGQKKLLWTLFPIPQEKISFSYTSNKLLLPSIQISILPKSPSIPLPDIDSSMMDLVGFLGNDSELFDLLGINFDIDPKKSLDQINKMQSLVDASKLAIEDTSAQLSSFTGAIGQLEKGLNELSGGATKLSELSKYHKKVLGTMQQSIKSNQDGLVAGVNAVGDAQSSSSKVSRELFAAKTQLEEVVGSVVKLEQSSTDQATIDTLGEIEKNIKNIISKIDTIKSDSDKTTATLKTLVDGGTISGIKVPPLSDLPGNLTILDQALTALIDGGEVLGVQMPGIQTTIDGLNQISTSIDTIVKGGEIGGEEYPPLSDVPNKLNKVMVEFNVLKDGGNFKGIDVPSQSGVVEMISSFKKSLVDLTPMKEKIDLLSSRLSSVIDKAGGVKKIEDATSNIEESVIIQEAEYNKMTELGNTYTSFIGQTEGADSSVLFVMKLKEVGSIQEQTIKSSNSNKSENPYSNINIYKYLILIISGLCIILAFVLNLVIKKRNNYK